jgi:hypothetical protein
MPKSTYLDNNVLNYVLLNGVFVAPTTIYVALYTVSPTPTTSGTEVTGGSYARQTVTFVSPTNGQTNNATTVSFPIASSSWGTIVAFGLLDSVSGGNLLYFSSLSSSRVVLVNDQIVFPTGQLIVTET